MRNLGRSSQISYILKNIIKELSVDASIERMGNSVLKVYIPKDAILNSIRNIPKELTAGLKEEGVRIGAGDYDLVEVYIGNDYKFNADMKYEVESKQYPIGYEIKETNE